MAKKERAKKENKIVFPWKASSRLLH